MISLKSLKDDGRLVAVGDKHQAIYGFTGANSNALDLIAAECGAVRLGLATTYRCPKSVVAYAQSFVSHIRPADAAKEGTVEFISHDDVTKSKLGDVILCRFNASLVNLAYKFINAGVSAKVEGCDIGVGLESIVKKMGTVHDLDELLLRLEKFRTKYVAKYTKLERMSDVASINEQVDCINIIIRRVKYKGGRSVDSLLAEINRMFGSKLDSRYAILSSIHKAKGREWKTDYWQKLTKITLPAIGNWIKRIIYVTSR